MQSVERRAAARANQRAAAFIRFQLLGDHDAMHLVLKEVGPDTVAGMTFATALGSIAGQLATSSLGREGALAYLAEVARTSGALSDAPDIDEYFRD
jgi:hypothetical protein